METRNPSQLPRKRKPMPKQRLFLRRALCLAALCIACAVVVFAVRMGASAERKQTETEVFREESEASQEAQSNDTALAATREELRAGLEPFAGNLLETMQGEGVLLDVSHMDQGNYPTGCESVSAVMLMNYYGIRVDAGTFIDTYLEKGECYEQDGQIYAPDPNEAFVGDPYTSWGFGVYAPAIAEAMEQCLPAGYTLVNETGTSLKELCSIYLDLGHPVLVWATISMVATSEGPTWNVTGTDRTFTWINNEHCLVLVGYDDVYYYFNDPLDYDAPTAYPRTLVEQRYEEMGMQALAIFP